MSKRKGPFTVNDDGTVTWKQRPFDIYVITGVDVNGKRFKPIRTTNWDHARMINLYRGTVWLRRDGKRYAIKKVYN